MPATISCPRCRISMNRHAAKVVDPRSADEVRGMDPDLGGVVAQVHSCPSCGGMAAVRSGSLDETP